MIMKRLSIIRQVNTVIEKVCKVSQDSDEEGEDIQEEGESMISYKKLVKIMNLCHIYIPIVQSVYNPANNSTKLSLDPMDLIELCKSKHRYKEFVDL